MGHLVSITSMDVILLLSLPCRPATLEQIIEFYCGANRDAPPGYDELEGFLGRMLSAGILCRVGKNSFELDCKWKDVVVSASLLPEGEDFDRLEGDFCSKKWPVVFHPEHTMSREEYEIACAEYWKGRR